MVAAIIQVQRVFLERKTAQNRIAGTGTILQKETLRSQIYMGIGKRGPRKGVLGQEKSSLQPLPESLSMHGFCPHPTPPLLWKDSMMLVLLGKTIQEAGP